MAPDRFAAAVVDLLREPGRREQVAAAGLACVKQNHDWGSLLVRLENLVVDRREHGATLPMAPLERQGT